MQKMIVANWKMNCLRADGRSLAADVAKFCETQTKPPQVVLCPPFTLLGDIAELLQINLDGQRGSSENKTFILNNLHAGDLRRSVATTSPRVGAAGEDPPLPEELEQFMEHEIALGAQDCHPEQKGAFTGDISARMLKDIGCSYVILGHSERRQSHNETDEIVAAKAKAAINAGISPIICVGETLEQRESGRAPAIISAQVRTSLPLEAASISSITIAYEPVWAIGSGKIPTLSEISEVHALIHDVVRDCFSGNHPPLRVLYGGSVKAANAGEILSSPKVGGLLVGGASLAASEFNAIIAAA